MLLRNAITPIVGHRKIASRRLDGAYIERRAAAAAPYRFGTIVNATDYCGVLRGCWAAGVSGDLLEIAFIDSLSNLNAYLNNKVTVWDAIAGATCTAFKLKSVPVSPEPVTPETKLYKLVVGPMSGGDKTTITAQARAL